MDYFTDRPNKFCKKLPHGLVLTSGCKRKCTFVCLPPYESEDRVRVVDCDVTSQKWLTSSGKTPCVIPAFTSTTKKYIDFDFPMNNDKFNIDYKYKTFPTFKPFDFDDVNIQTVKPFNIDDDYHQDSSTVNNSSTAAMPGLIATGIILLTILSVCMRLWVVRTNTRRRQRRIQNIQNLVEQMNSNTRSRIATQQRLPNTSPQNLTEQARREQRQTVVPVRSSTEEANTEEGNDNTGMFIVIRRIFRFPLSRIPYTTLQTPASPPPYDAESVPPPAYEETEGTNSFSSDVTNQPSVVQCSETSETPDDSPPPYTEII